MIPESNHPTQFLENKIKQDLASLSVNFVYRQLNCGEGMQSELQAIHGFQYCCKIAYAAIELSVTPGIWYEDIKALRNEILKNIESIESCLNIEHIFLDFLSKTSADDFENHISSLLTEYSGTEYYSAACSIIGDSICTSIDSYKTEPDGIPHIQKEMLEEIYQIEIAKKQKDESQLNKIIVKLTAKLKRIDIRDELKEMIMYERRLAIVALIELQDRNSAFKKTESILQDIKRPHERVEILLEILKTTLSKQKNTLSQDIAEKILYELNDHTVSSLENTFSSLGNIRIQNNNRYFTHRDNIDIRLTVALLLSRNKKQFQTLINKFLIDTDKNGNKISYLDQAVQLEEVPIWINCMKLCSVLYSPNVVQKIYGFFITKVSDKTAKDTLNREYFKLLIQLGKNPNLDDFDLLNESAIEMYYYQSLFSIQQSKYSSKLDTHDQLRSSLTLEPNVSAQKTCYQSASFLNDSRIIHGMDYYFDYTQSKQALLELYQDFIHDVLRYALLKQNEGLCIEWLNKHMSLENKIDFYYDYVCLQTHIAEIQYRILDGYEE